MERRLARPCSSTMATSSALARISSKDPPPPLRVHNLGDNEYRCNRCLATSDVDQPRLASMDGSHEPQRVG